MKHYDKIFFIVALLALCASFVCFNVMQMPKIGETQAKVEKLLSQKAKGVEWKDVEVPRLEIKPIEWPEVKPQDEDGRWFFQVFTPPQIWVDEDGKFITESPLIKERARMSFALKYEGVSNEPYPIKYKGYMGSADDPYVQLYNEADKVLLTGKKNKPITIQVKGENGLAKSVDVGLTVKSFESKRIKKADNTLANIVTVVLFDKKLGRDITLYSDKPTVLEDSRRMTLILPDGAQWHVKAAGESKDIADAKYTVKDLNFDKEYAIVEMLPSNKEIPPQTMKLSKDGVAPVKSAKK